MSERELKPCPFCERPDPFVRNDGAIYCDGCEVVFHGPETVVQRHDGIKLYSGKATAYAWNRRAPAGESVTGWAEYLDGDESEGWSQWRFDGGSPNEDSYGRVRAVLTFIDSP